MSEIKNKKRKEYTPREMVYAGESIPEITMENHPDFIFHYQKSVLSSLVKRELLTASQMERVMDELKRQHVDYKKTKDSLETKES